MFFLPLEIPCFVTMLMLCRHPTDIWPRFWLRYLWKSKHTFMNNHITTASQNQIWKFKLFLFSFNRNFLLSWLYLQMNKLRRVSKLEKLKSWINFLFPIEIQMKEKFISISTFNVCRVSFFRRCHINLIFPSNVPLKNQTLCYDPSTSTMLCALYFAQFFNK